MPLPSAKGNVPPFCHFKCNHIQDYHMLILQYGLISGLHCWVLYKHDKDVISQDFWLFLDLDLSTEHNSSKDIRYNIC